jgi:hypothetical protein
MSDKSQCQVAGLEPWLPWPLCASDWWTKPVRAEHLAVLRIAVAGCLLIDMLTSYRPHLHDFFGQDGLGGSRLFAYYAEAPNLNWSLLRGFGDPVLGALAIAIWLTLTIWFAVDFWGRLSASDKPDASAGNSWGTAAWLAAGLFVVLAVWSRTFKDDTVTRWTVPLAMSSFAVLYVFLELWARRRERRLVGLAANALTLLVMAGLGLVLPLAESMDRYRPLRPCQDAPWLLEALFWIWAAAAALLLVGWWTRLAAVVTWALSMSFANANPNIDNAGDVIRGIILFYLMLCPCGAVWSLDRLMQRRRANAAPAVYVWPWPLRLLFLQLVLIYFMNGLYKLSGADWPLGNSLYYVLCDLTLTRFSIAQLPVPFIAAKAASWLVLAWELSFPILVCFRRTRWLALAFGLLFHLGILATMELGGFVPYVLCLYLPLLPWDRWLGDKPSPEHAAGRQEDHTSSSSVDSEANSTLS